MELIFNIKYEHFSLFDGSVVHCGSISLMQPEATGNGPLLTMIARFLLHGGYRAIFMSQEKLFQLCHFISQQGDFTLEKRRVMYLTNIRVNISYCLKQVKIKKVKLGIFNRISRNKQNMLLKCLINTHQFLYFSIWIKTATFIKI